MLSKKATKMSVRRKLQFLVCLGGLGVLVSLYLLKMHIAPDSTSGICEINSIVSCQAVNTSAYSEMFGVPVAWLGAYFFPALREAPLSCLPDLGVIWFTGVIWLSAKLLQCHNNEVLGGLMVWSLGGVGTVLYLVYAEVQLGAICPACTVVQACALLTAVICYTMRRMLSPTTTIWKIAQALRGFIFFMGAVAALSWFFFNVRPPTQMEATASFTQCLAAKGITVYWLEGCSHCDVQRELFGKSFLQLPNVECSADEAACTKMEIEGTPTWILGAERREGVQDLKSLAEWTGCAYNNDDTA